MQAQTVPTKLPFWRQLRSQLMLYFIVLAVGAIIIITGFTLVQVRNQSTQQAFQRLESVIELKRNQISQWLESANLLLNLIDADIHQRADLLYLLQSGSMLPAARDVLNSILQGGITAQRRLGGDEQAILEEVWVYDIEGRVMGASDEALVNRVVTLQPYFERGFESRYIQSPYYDVSSGELTMVITHPLTTAEGAVVGVLVGRLNINLLRDVTAERAGLGETGETYLVSSENNYLLTPSRFDGYSMNRAYHSDGIDAALQEQNGSGIYENYQNPSVAVLGQYRWIPELNAALMAEISVVEAQTLLIQTSSIIVALGVLITGIAAVLGLAAANSISRPITQLTHTVQEISGGDLSQRAALHTQNEIGTLANAFNSMTQRLQDTISNLENNISALEQSKRERERLISELRDALIFKDQFMATMSHELRTPLNAVLGFSGIALMQDHEMTPKTRHLMERIKANSHRLLNLINDILDISRINAGRVELVSRPINLAKLSEGWRTDFTQQAREKNLDFLFEYDPALPEQILADEERVSQIISNLLVNAIKFTDQGHIKLAVQQEQAQLKIVVSDTGIGIPDTWQHLIFDEFRQVDGSSKRKYGGAGLGLSIVKKLCLLMGGSVSVSSKPGKGSTFTILLPLQPVPIAA
jgi:signal transduction histidine kinase